jgi:cell division protein FtsB
MRTFSFIFSLFSFYIIISLFFSKSSFFNIQKLESEKLLLEGQVEARVRENKIIAREITLLQPPVNRDFLKLIIKENLFFIGQNEYLLKPPNQDSDLANSAIKSDSNLIEVEDSNAD